MKSRFLIIVIVLTGMLTSCGVYGNYASNSIYDDAVYYHNDPVYAEAKEFLQEYERDIYALNKGETYSERLNKFNDPNSHITIKVYNNVDPWYNPWWGSGFGWYSPWHVSNHLCWNNHTWYWNLNWNAGWYYPWYDPWYDPWYGPGYYSYHPYHWNTWHPVVPGYQGSSKNVVYGHRASEISRNAGRSTAFSTPGIRSGSSYSQTRREGSSIQGSYSRAGTSNVRQNSSMSTRSAGQSGGNTTNVRQGTTREQQNARDAQSSRQQSLQRNSSQSNVRSGSGSTATSPIIRSGASSMGGAVRGGSTGGFSGGSSMGGGVRGGSGGGIR